MWQRGKLRSPGEPELESGLPLCPLRLSPSPTHSPSYLCGSSGKAILVNVYQVSICAGFSAAVPVIRVCVREGPGRGWMSLQNSGAGFCGWTQSCLWGSFQIEHRGRESTLQRPAGGGQRQGAGHTHQVRQGRAQRGAEGRLGAVGAPSEATVKSSEQRKDKVRFRV